MLRGTYRLRTGNQPIRFHLLASGVGRESVASSCRTFAKGILHTTARVSDPASSSMPAAPPSRRSCRCYRGSLPSLAPRSRLHDRLVIAALPRPAASLGAALGRGPHFCGSYLVCLLALAVPAGWIPPYDDGLASGLAFLVRASALTRKQVLVIRAKSAWSGLQLQCAPRL